MPDRYRTNEEHGQLSCVRFRTLQTLFRTHPTTSEQTILVEGLAITTTSVPQWVSPQDVLESRLGLEPSVDHALSIAGQGHIVVDISGREQAMESSEVDRRPDQLREWQTQRCWHPIDYDDAWQT